MILTGREIRAQIERRRIQFEPFSADMLNPNSVDLRLGRTLLAYTDETIDPSVASSVREMTIPDDGLVLEAGSFVLGCTEERLGSAHYVPLLHGKSSTARAGLFVHVTADLIDLGSFGQLTLQMHPLLNIRIFKGMRIAQVSFWRCMGEIDLYEGKYQGSRGPQASRIHEDWSLSNEQTRRA
jgi:dCTP deaminase